MPFINYENVPGGMISGMGDDLLEWVTRESNERRLYEISNGFLDHLNTIENSENITDNFIEEELNGYFVDLDASTLEEMDDMEESSIPNSSKKQMNSVITRFKNFLRENNLSENINELPPKIMNNYLRYFYSQLRKNDGSFYSPKSLICFRAAIHRYLCLHRPEINIIDQLEFKQSNRMLCTMIAKFKNSGQKKESSYEVIQDKDMAKIRSYFDRSDGEILQREVMFNLIYYFGLRGRETLPTLTKDSIVVLQSSTGKRYLAISHELLTKNSKASLLQKEFEDCKNARAYENSECPSECPVAAWELYSKHIADSPSLFPKPCKLKSKKMKKWFSPSRKVGKNTVDNLMSNLSTELKLSRRYTNHCIRVTMVTVLKENGFSNTEICSYTGHKTPQSVDRYSRKRRDEDFEGMSSALSSGTTSHRVVEVHQVSKRSRVTVTTRIPSRPPASEGCENSMVPVVNINFSGSFQNCEFHIPELR